MARSLAEGPHSLWGGRSAAGGTLPTGGETLPFRKRQASGRDAAGPSSETNMPRLANATPRPGTAPSLPLPSPKRLGAPAACPSGGKTAPVQSNNTICKSPIDTSSSLAFTALRVAKTQAKATAASKGQAHELKSAARNVRFDGDDRGKGTSKASVSSSKPKERASSASRLTAASPNKVGR